MKFEVNLVPFGSCHWFKLSWRPASIIVLPTDTRHYFLVNNSISIHFFRKHIMYFMYCLTKPIILRIFTHRLATINISFLVVVFFPFAETEGKVLELIFVQCFLWKFSILISASIDAVGRYVCRVATTICLTKHTLDFIEPSACLPHTIFPSCSNSTDSNSATTCAHVSVYYVLLIFHSSQRYYMASNLCNLHRNR